MENLKLTLFMNPCFKARTIKLFKPARQILLCGVTIAASSKDERKQRILVDCFFRKRVNQKDINSHGLEFIRWNGIKSYPVPFKQFVYRNQFFFVIHH